MRVLFLGLILGFSLAQADENTDLYVCQGQSSELAQSLFVKESGGNAWKRVVTTKLTIGQDLREEAPVFEIKLEGLDAQKNIVAGPITVRRVALARSEKGNVSVTYSATRTPGSQNPSVFNLYIPSNMNAKLTFVQQNNRNAPVYPKFDLGCEEKAEEVRVPQTLDIDSYGDVEQAKIIKSLRAKLPNRSIYIGDDDDGKRPDDIVATAEEQIRNRLSTMTMNEAVLRKLTYTENKPDATLRVLDDHCSKVELERVSLVRDFSGKDIAYVGQSKCRNVGLIVTTKGKEGKPDVVSKYAFGLNKVYLTSSRTNFEDAAIGLQRVWDKEEE